MKDHGLVAYSIDYQNLSIRNKEATISFLKTIEEQLAKSIRMNDESILERVAKELSLRCLKNRVSVCDIENVSQQAFEKIIHVFDECFSDYEYWDNNLENLFYGNTKMF